MQDRRTKSEIVSRLSLATFTRSFRSSGSNFTPTISNGYLTCDLRRTAFKRLSLVDWYQSNLANRLRLTWKDRLLLLDALEVYSNSISSPRGGRVRDKGQNDVARLAERLIYTRTGPKFGNESYSADRARYFTDGRKRLSAERHAVQEKRDKPIRECGWSIGRRICRSKGVLVGGCAYRARVKVKMKK